MLRDIELVKWLKLVQVPKLGPAKMQKLFTFVSSIENLFKLSEEQLGVLRIFDEKMIEEFVKLKRASDDSYLKVVQDCKDNDIDIVPIIDERYPFFLKRISYPPLTLFLKGDSSLLYEKKIAIIGSRKADEKAKKWAYDLAKDAVKKNLVVVSGGAFGIDYSAHTGALDINGKTICVLGSGFFKMYPEEHKELFDKVSKTGLLVSEHLPNFTGSRVALVQRNRITSGLSNAIVMVASGERGGSMVQIKMAYEQRVPIFCPNLKLNLLPNEGIPQIMNDWKGIQINSFKDIFLREFNLENKNDSKTILDFS